jgi:hypothetical protein
VGTSGARLGDAAHAARPEAAAGSQFLVTVQRTREKNVRDRTSEAVRASDIDVAIAQGWDFRD